MAICRGLGGRVAVLAWTASASPPILSFPVSSGFSRKKPVCQRCGPSPRGVPASSQRPTPGHGERGRVEGSEGRGTELDPVPHPILFVTGQEAEGRARDQALAGQSSGWQRRPGAASVQEQGSVHSLH